MAVQVQNKMREAIERGRQKSGCLSVALGVALLSLLSGCMVPIPEFDRNGEYFYLTRKYPETQFFLWGAELTQSTGKFEILPPLSAIFPGLPLLLAEKCVICPAVDILWLPEDFFRNCYLQSDRAIANNGYYVQVMDVYGKPLKGIKVGCSGGEWYDHKEPILNGRRTRERFVGYTDENGELYVPFDCTAVESVAAGATAFSEQGAYESHYYDEDRHRNSNPDDNFPKRDRLIKIVMEPKMVYDKTGHNPKWGFQPNENSELKESPLDQN